MSEISIFITSDLHTEFQDCEIEVEKFPDANILVLAGDIGNVQQLDSSCYQNTIEQFSKKYRDVVVIAGNHEYYGCDYDRNKVITKLRKICDQFQNVHFLQRESKVIQGIEFIGVTLWTLISKESSAKINDIRQCVFHSYIENVCEFADDFRFLKETLSTKNIYPRIVITHHLPWFNLINPRFRCLGFNDAFYTNILDEVNLRGVKLWACGHTHEYVMSKYMDTTFVVNPIGYPKEKRYTQFSKEVYTVVTE